MSASNPSFLSRVRHLENNVLYFNTVSLKRYELLTPLGEGTYGMVHLARDINSNQLVALKKLHSFTSFPPNSIREINLLTQISHQNLIKFHHVAVGPKIDDVFLVFDYCLYDLSTLLESLKNNSSLISCPFNTKLSHQNHHMLQQSSTNNWLNMAQVKCVLLSILKGAAHLHSNFVMHRDLKLSNCLITRQNEIVIADFGLSRQFSKPPADEEFYTPTVVTLWYRAPELLLNINKYHSAIDMFSIGCIFGELILTYPMIKGNSVLEQLHGICQLIGTPTKQDWPEFEEKMEEMGYEVKDKSNVNRLAEKFPTLSFAGLSLLNQLLLWDPVKRISAQSAIEHEWFREDPLPCHESDLPVLQQTNPQIQKYLEEELQCSQRKRRPRSFSFVSNDHLGKNLFQVHETVSYFDEPPSKRRKFSGIG